MVLQLFNIFTIVISFLIFCSSSLSKKDYFNIKNSMYVRDTHICELLTFIHTVCKGKSRIFQNHAIFKITHFSKSRDFQNHAFFKITRFSKSRVFQNHAFFKIMHFSKSRVFQNHAIFKITRFSKFSKKLLHIFKNMYLHKKLKNTFT